MQCECMHYCAACRLRFLCPGAFCLWHVDTQYESNSEASLHWLPRKLACWTQLLQLLACFFALKACLLNLHWTGFSKGIRAPCGIWGSTLTQGCARLGAAAGNPYNLGAVRMRRSAFRHSVIPKRVSAMLAYSVIVESPWRAPSDLNSQSNTVCGHANSVRTLKLSP